MMSQEIKKQWVAALRSGEYKQGTGKLNLRAGSAFCCLGVLCDIYVKQTEVPWYKLNLSIRGEVLPLEVMKWADLKAANPIPGDGYNLALAHRNDTGETFEQIADLIEAEL